MRLMKTAVLVACLSAAVAQDVKKCIADMTESCGAVQSNATACFACLHEPATQKKIHADCEGTGEAKRFCGDIGKRLYVALYDTSTRGCGSEGTLPATDAVGYSKPSIVVYDVGSDGGLTKVAEVAAGLNVSWITPGSSGSEGSPDTLYAVSEVCLYNKSKTGTVGAFKVTESGLEFINRVPTGGQQPVYAEASPNKVIAAGADRTLLVAQYTEGTVSLLVQDPNSGAVHDKKINAVSEGDPKKTATHESRFLPPSSFSMGNSYALVPALALDKVDIYRYLGDTAELGPSYAPNPQTALQLPAGFGPRHIAFHPNGHTAFLANEGSADSPSRMSVLEYTITKDAGLKLSLVQTISTIPASMNQTNIYPAEVLVSPDGKFVYLSNRDGNPGPVLRDNIAVFSVDSSASDGVTAKLIDNAKCGHYPRSMTLSDNGFLYVGAQKGKSVDTYKASATTGLLTPVGAPLAFPDSVGFVVVL